MIFVGTMLYVLIFASAWRWPRDGDAARQAAREKADAEYASLVVSSSEPRLAFNAATAEVLSVKEQSFGFSQWDGTTGHYAVTRYARNEYGEIFMILCGSDHYIKHVSPNIAKIALKL